MQTLRPWPGLLAAGVLVVTLGWTNVAVRGQQPAPGVDRIDFSTQVRPLLSDRCFSCHGPDAAKRKAKLRLDTRDGALSVVEPGDPDGSELVRRILTDYADETMPPPESNLVLSEAEKGLLQRWIAEGADYRTLWSLEPVRNVRVPTLESVDTAPAANAIDAFVRVRLAQAGLDPAPPARPEALIRRLTLTLTGLPPTTAEIDAFAADPSPAAYAAAVERYLASPAYGERMAVDWLDLARYADTYGYQNDVERDMSPYRDWVIRAFNDNLSYDRFLTWQLAGDLLPDATREQRIATAFNRLHRQTNEGGSIEEEFRIEYVLDRVNTFGTAVLGLTLECARCHDHKFDPITQRDYFSLAAFFNSIDESGLYSHYTNATPTPTLLLWPSHEQQRHEALSDLISAGEARLQEIAAGARRAFGEWLVAHDPVVQSNSAPPDAPPCEAGQASVPCMANRAGVEQGIPVVTPAPVAHLAFDTVNGDTTPDLVGAPPATLHDAPQLVRDAETGERAVQFSGDNAIVHPGVRTFRRTDPFSIAIRLKPTERQDRAIVVHQSRAWTDAGSRGFELTLEHGKPFFGLVHFWPGNAIAVRARDPLPLDAWSHLVVTYDGSSRAAGIRIYVNGTAVTADIVRDRLYKDIDYDALPGEKEPPPHPFTIGARFRDSGFKNGLVDDLRVFDTTLTAVEIAGVLSRDPDDEDAFTHFLARHHVPYRAAVAELRRLREEENRLVAHVPELMVMEETPQPRPAHLLARGAYDAPGDVVPRDTPGSLQPFPSDQPRNRLGLARWVTDPRNPLTARVAVNRIWRMHFGRGIVASQEDFGSQGSLPTHPELLDWLADRFVRDGWDVKALHRLIVSSATFQQASHASPETVGRDPDNLLLSRAPTRQLQAEWIRDGALAASGLLNRTVGGPSVKPYQPEGLWEQAGTGKTYVQDTGDKLYRRSLYTFWRRTSPPPSMAAFDAPTREVCVPRRETTVTPLQSLVLLNDPQFVEAARAMAERLLRAHPRDVAARNRAAFRTLTGRAPDEREAAVLARAFEEQRALFAADPASARALLGIGESPRDEDLPPVDLAAMTAVASLIMNHDEFTVVR